MLSFLIITIVSRVMPRKTRQGTDCLGADRWSGGDIRRAEVEEIQEQDRRGVFERLLPYAIAFGLADRWAEAFEGLYTEPPNWYQSSHNGPFSTAMLGSSINHAVSNMNSTLPSQPRSSGGSGGSGWSSGFSGGGSSGGGFGGGGGGSVIRKPRGFASWTSSVKGPVRFS